MEELKIKNAAEHKDYLKEEVKDESENGSNRSSSRN